MRRQRLRRPIGWGSFISSADRRPRDWLHWVGIVDTTTLAIVELANQVRFRLPI